MNKALIALGVAFALLGGVALYTGGFTYPQDEAVLDMGPIEASATVEEEVEVPPLVAGSAVLAGLILVGVGARRGR